MIAIPQVVREIVVSTPFLEEAIGQGLINASAYARLIRPRVEKRLLKRVETAAILMAIRRMKTARNQENRLIGILKSTIDFIVRSNLTEFVLANSDFTGEIHRRLIDLVSEERSHLMTITEGVFETTIIASSSLEGMVKKIFRNKKIITVLSDLSAITLRLPKENVTIPGVYYFFLKVLAWHGINLIEVVSTYSEFTLILETKEVDKAFSVLKRSLVA